jgi:hypothetical protein
VGRVTQIIGSTIIQLGVLWCKFDRLRTYHAREEAP